MFRCFSLLLLLLFCPVCYSGNTDLQVLGKKGGNVTLTCEFKANKIFEIELFSETEDIDVCQIEECSGRIFKKATCDVVINNLSFTDAGKYTLRVHYDNDQSKVAQQKERKYQLHIHDEITVKTGNPLKMDILLSIADKVEKNSSGEWRELWKRGHGVCCNRMTDTDGNLIINEFMDSDAGTYRVLDSEGKILTTVTVTGTESTGKLDTDKTGDTGEHKKWILPVGVCLGILVLAVVVIAVILWRRRDRGYMQGRVQENPEPPEVLGNL